MNDCLCGCGEKFEVEWHTEYDWVANKAVTFYWAMCDKCGITKSFDAYSEALYAAKAGEYSPWKEYDTDEIESMRRILE